MSGGVPLLQWLEIKNLAMLESKRKVLLQRIRELPRFSHQRIVLEARAAAITTEIIKAECDLSNDGDRQ